MVALCANAVGVVRVKPGGDGDGDGENLAAFGFCAIVELRMPRAAEANDRALWQSRVLTGNGPTDTGAIHVQVAESGRMAINVHSPNASARIDDGDDS